MSTGRRDVRLARGSGMAVLHHGTTRQRADAILAGGPDPDFTEPGGGRAEGFSACLAGGPFPLGTPEQYARGKAALFPTEGGPVKLVVDVPDAIIALAAGEPFFPLSQGVVQFEPGAGLEELRAAWPTLAKRVEPV